jgi:ketosteroid isomerase-like protein
MQANSEAILALETRFWQSMVDKDPDTAMTLIADQCLITGPMGTLRITPLKYAEMTRASRWTLDRFEFTDVSVVHPSADTAVIAYQVHQTGTMNDQRMDLHCADSTTWVRDGRAWKCVLHTETVMGQPQAAHRPN